MLIGVGYSVIGLSQYGTTLIVGAYCNSVPLLLMHLVLMITYLGMAIASAGSSVPQTLSGVVGSFAARSEMGMVYANLAFTELAGGMIGSLALAWLFDIGAKLGGTERWGLGLPFWISAVGCGFEPFLKLNCFAPWTLTNETFD